MRTPREHCATDGTTTWRVRFRLDGHQSSESFHDEARAVWFAQLLDLVGPYEALKQLYDGERAGNEPTVDELAEQFFAWKEDRVRSDRTVADYRRDYRNWIQPVFGQRPADTVTEANVQDWVDAMGKEGGVVEGKKLGPKSIADRHAVLHGIFGWAIAPSRGQVQHNPCVGTDLPARPKKPPKALRPAEYRALRAALVQVDADAADLADFLADTGWRFSEGAALSAYAVEDYGEGQPLYVTMGQVIRRNAAGQHVIVEDAKSTASEGRRTKLDTAAAARVRRRLEKVTGDDLVFTNKSGKQWHYSNFLNRAWNPAVELAQLNRRPTPHWLRHSHVTWLIMAGAGLAEIQARVGHEDINTTIGVYGRMVNDVSDDALTRFAAFRDQAARPAVPAAEPPVELAP